MGSPIGTGNSSSLVSGTQSVAQTIDRLKQEVTRQKRIFVKIVIENSNEMFRNYEEIFSAIIEKIDNVVKRGVIFKTEFNYFVLLYRIDMVDVAVSDCYIICDFLKKLFKEEDKKNILSFKALIDQSNSFQGIVGKNILKTQMFHLKKNAIYSEIIRKSMKNTISITFSIQKKKSEDYVTKFYSLFNDPKRNEIVQVFSIENEWIYEMELKEKQRVHMLLNDASGLVVMKDYAGALKNLKEYVEDGRKDDFIALTLMKICERQLDSLDNQKLKNDVNEMPKKIRNHLRKLEIKKKEKEKEKKDFVIKTPVNKKHRKEIK